MPIQNVLFRKSVYEKHGGFDLEIDHQEDWNLWCRYAQEGDFVHVPKTTALYRVPGDKYLKAQRDEKMLAALSSVAQKNGNLGEDRQGKQDEQLTHGIQRHH